MAAGDLVYLKAASGKSITLGTSGNIITPHNNILLPQSTYLAFMHDGTNVVMVSGSPVRILETTILDKDTLLTVGDWAGGVTFTVPLHLNGYNLIYVQGALTGAQSTSGLPTIQMANITDAVDMLSTRITIDANEWDSKDAATAPVINTSYDDVATGDRIRFDIDVAGTGAKGLNVIHAYQKP
jgi:hypothetical protein